MVKLGLRLGIDSADGNSGCEKYLCNVHLFEKISLLQFRNGRIFFFFVSMDQHEEDLETTLSIRGTSESLHTRLMEHLRVKRRELKETTNKLQNLKQQLSSKQTRKRMIA